MVDNYKEFQVGMSWDSYEGSLFRETYTTWIYAYTKEEAKQKVSAQFSHNKGFRIEYVD